MSNLCTRVVPSPAPAAMAGPTSPPVPKSQNTVATTVSAADSVFSSHAVNTTTSASPKNKITTMGDLLRDYVGNTQETDKTQKARQIVERLAQDKTIKTSNLSNESVTRFIDLIHIGMVHNTETEAPCSTRIANAICVLQKLVDNDKQPLSYENCCHITHMVWNYRKDCISNGAWSDAHRARVQDLVNTLVFKKHIFSSCEKALQFIDKNFSRSPSNRFRDYLRLTVYTRSDMSVTPDEKALPEISTDMAASFLVGLSNESKGKIQAFNIILKNNAMPLRGAVDFAGKSFNGDVCDEVFDAILKKFPESDSVDHLLQLSKDITNLTIWGNYSLWMIKRPGDENSPMKPELSGPQVKLLLEIIQEAQDQAVLIDATQNCWSICVLLRHLINNDKQFLSEDNCLAIVTILGGQVVREDLLKDRIQLIVDMGCKQHIFADYNKSLDFINSVSGKAVRGLYIAGVCQRQDLPRERAQTLLVSIPDEMKEKRQTIDSILQRKEMSFVDAVAFAACVFEKANLGNAVLHIAAQYSTKVVAKDVARALEILKANQVSLEVLGPLAASLIGNEGVSSEICKEVFQKVIVSKACCRDPRAIIAAFVAREDISLEMIEEMKNSFKDSGIDLYIIEELLNQYGTLGLAGESGSDAKTKSPVVIKVTKGNDSIDIKKSNFSDSADGDRIRLQWVERHSNISLTQALPLLQECAEGVSTVALGAAIIACIRRKEDLDNDLLSVRTIFKDKGSLIQQVLVAIKN